LECYHRSLAPDHLRDYNRDHTTVLMAFTLCCRAVRSQPNRGHSAFSQAARTYLHPRGALVPPPISAYAGGRCAVSL
jgi:hypothetical protein